MREKIQGEVEGKVQTHSLYAMPQALVAVKALVCPQSVRAGPAKIAPAKAKKRASWTFIMVGEVWRRRWALGWF
jgi:hypothetical protein